MEDEQRAREEETVEEKIETREKSEAKALDEEDLEKVAGGNSHDDMLSELSAKI